MKKQGTTRILRASCLGALAGIVCAVVAVLVVLMVRARRDRLPDLDPGQFRTAMETWDESAPDDYDIVIEVSGRQPAVYEVHVRGGKVVDAKRNGHPLRQPRTMGTWSVPGMFGTMEQDVRNVEAVAEGTASSGTPRLTLRARFDPQWHFPARYQRIDWGSQYEIAWKVIHFEVLGAADP